MFQHVNILLLVADNVLGRDYNEMHCESSYHKQPSSTRTQCTDELSLCVCQLLLWRRCAGASGTSGPKR
jgi:hypothetical protein